jgi:hypothetical protein
MPGWNAIEVLLDILVNHVKPLLPFLASDGVFYILALSQNQLRLLAGTRHTVDEIDLENVPETLSEAS